MSKVYVEDAYAFLRKSKTYAEVIKHRKSCPKWKKGFCLGCFGGGLTKFHDSLTEEVMGRELKKMGEVKA